MKPRSLPLEIMRVARSWGAWRLRDTLTLGAGAGRTTATFFTGVFFATLAVFFAGTFFAGLARDTDAFFFGCDLAVTRARERAGFLPLFADALPAFFTTFFFFLSDAFAIDYVVIVPVVLIKYPLFKIFTLSFLNG